MAYDIRTCSLKIDGAIWLQCVMLLCVWRGNSPVTACLRSAKLSGADIMERLFMHKRKSKREWKQTGDSERNTKTCRTSSDDNRFVQLFRNLLPVKLFRCLPNISFAPVSYEPEVAFLTRCIDGMVKHPFRWSFIPFCAWISTDIYQLTWIKCIIC